MSKIGHVNLAGKSLAERKGKSVVDVSASRKADLAVDSALLAMAGEGKRVGKRERLKMRRQLQARVSQAESLPQIHTVSKTGKIGVWTPSVSPSKLLGNSHTRGFHGPGMGKSGRKPLKPHKIYDLDGFTERKVEKALKGH